MEKNNSKQKSSAKFNLIEYRSITRKSDKKMQQQRN